MFKDIPIFVMFLLQIPCIPSTPLKNVIPFPNGLPRFLPPAARSERHRVDVGIVEPQRSTQRPEGDRMTPTGGFHSHGGIQKWLVYKEKSY